MKSHSTEAHIINNRLHALYGNHVETDSPLFRVVWSDDQFERRKGEFWVTEAGICLPEPIKEIRTVHKYPYFENQWVLEVLTFVPDDSEIQRGYTYEPLYAFDSGLPLNWFAVQRAANCYINKVKSNNPKTQKEAEYQENEKLRKAKEVVKNRLDNTALASALHDRDASSYSGLDGRPSKLGVQ